MCVLGLATNVAQALRGVQCALLLDRAKNRVTGVGKREHGLLLIRSAPTPATVTSVPSDVTQPRADDDSAAFSSSVAVQAWVYPAPSRVNSLNAVTYGSIHTAATQRAAGRSYSAARWIRPEHGTTQSATRAERRGAWGDPSATNGGGVPGTAPGAGSAEVGTLAACAPSSNKQRRTSVASQSARSAPRTRK